MNLTLLASDIARRCPALTQDTPLNAAQVIEGLIREELFPKIPGARTYPLFKHLADEHNLTLLESEMQDIISLCHILYPEATPKEEPSHTKFSRELKPFPKKHPDQAGFWWFKSPSDSAFQMVECRQIGQRILLYSMSEGWGGYDNDALPGEWIQVPRPSAKLNPPPHPYACPKCNSRLAHAETIGNPIPRCPSCLTTLEFKP